MRTSSQFGHTNPIATPRLCAQLDGDYMSDVAPVIPNDPETLLTREQAAAALTASGYPVRPATLATKAVRGGGPPYQLFGNKPLYRWGPTLGWAVARLTSPRASTSAAKSHQVAA